MSPNQSHKCCFQTWSQVPLDKLWRVEQWEKRYITQLPGTAQASGEPKGAPGCKRFQQTFTQKWLHLQTYHGFLNYYIFQFYSEISNYTAKSRSMCCCPPTAMAVPFPNFGSYEWLFGLNMMRARPTCIKYHETWWNPNWLLQSTSKCINVRIGGLKKSHVFVQFSTPEMTGLWSQYTAVSPLISGMHSPMILPPLFSESVLS